MSIKKLLEWRRVTKEIVDWNKKTFPKNSNGLQILKLRGEVKELNEALLSANEEDIIEECADVTIAYLGLKRFGCKNKSEVQIFNLIKEIAAHEGFDLLEAVKRKMKINKERVFEEKEDGTHQHKILITGGEYEKTKH